MEYCFNGLWVFLSWIFLGPFLWSLWNTRNEPVRLHVFRDSIAGLSLVALLFPVISLSDDLASAHRLWERHQGPGHGPNQVMEDERSGEVRRVPPPIADARFDAPDLDDQPFLWIVTDGPPRRTIEVAVRQNHARAPPRS